MVNKSKSPNSAHAFINYMLSTSFQQQMPATIGFGPVTRDAQVPAELALYFPSENLFLPDWRFLGAHLPEIVDLWNREVGTVMALYESGAAVDDTEKKQASHPTSGETYLGIDQVTIAYGGLTVLHALSLSIAPGEFFCLLGPSGCGKTTTLNVVAGFMALTSGRVTLGGRDVTSLPPQQRRIGLVFQNYALFPHMTVAQNIGYGLRLQRRPAAEIKRKVDELTSLVQLGGKTERYPRQLSGGEQQRVAIARALAIEPDLLLLDEPLSNLDARLREDMRGELKRIQRATGVTTVFVTHDQEEAFGLGDRVAVMNKGRLEQIGSPAEIYRAPRTQFVARFIGRSNRLSGEAHPDRQRFDIDGHSFACTVGSAASSGPLTLFIRPEDMLISARPFDTNSLAGKIVEAVYGGTIVTYRVDTPIGVLEVAKLGIDGEGFSHGQPVHVSWPAGAGVLLADGQP